MNPNHVLWFLFAGMIAFAVSTGVLSVKTFSIDKENEILKYENDQLLKGVERYNSLKEKYDSLTITYIKQEMVLENTIKNAQGQSEVVRGIIERQRNIMDTVVINDSVRNEYLRHLRERSGN